MTLRFAPLQDMAATCVGVATALIAALSMAAVGATQPVEGSRATSLSELGILHAFAGDLVRAESVFVLLLSTVPGDARALTNLGNVALLRDDPSLALVLYDRAVLADSLDGGIRLNSAILLALMGRESESQLEMREGLRLAGNATAASTLLGLRSQATFPDDRGAPRAFPIAEVRDRMQSALHGMAGDSTQSHPAATIPDALNPRPRSAGLRADDIGDASVLLYWKR